MLKPAQLYADKLREEHIKSWYSLENMYWYADACLTGMELPEDTSMHCFVSVDKEDNVIGYIHYTVNWEVMSADYWGIISFRKNSIIFAKDLYTAICNCFSRFNLNRISWACYADNPAIRGYRNFIRLYGGRECGYFRQSAKLLDGKLHDKVQFEILKEEFCGKQMTVGRG